MERLVVAEAGEPRDRQAIGVELAHGALQQARVVREAELAPVEVGPARAVTVGFPEEVVRPAERLDALRKRRIGGIDGGAGLQQLASWVMSESTPTTSTVPARPAEDACAARASASARLRGPSADKAVAGRIAAVSTTGLPGTSRRCSR